MSPWEGLASTPRPSRHTGSLLAELVWWWWWVACLALTLQVSRGFKRLSEESHSAPRALAEKHVAEESRGWGEPAPLPGLAPASGQADLALLSLQLGRMTQPF